MRASILAFLVAVSGLMPVGSFGDEAALRNRSAYAEGKLLGAMIREFIVLKYESGDSEQLAIVRERATLLSKALNELMWGLERRKRARYDFEPRLTEEEVLDRDFWKGVEAGLGTRIAVKNVSEALSWVQGAIIDATLHRITCEGFLVGMPSIL